MTVAGLQSVSEQGEEEEEEQAQVYVTAFHRLHRNANFSFFQVSVL